ncbi:hypothetical protein BA897_04155 [Spiribacter roseus]|nr:hypothetical protein BA897_04155 [Spiribacter roseus]
MVRHKGEIIALAMIYHVSTIPMSSLDWVVIDPGLESEAYDDALITLVNALTKRAQSNGAKTVWALFQSEHDCRVATDHCDYIWGEAAIDVLTSSKGQDNPSSDAEPTMDRFIGGSFAPGASITMADGSEQLIEAVRVGDFVDQGGLVTGAVQVNLTHTYDYSGLICAGENLVWNEKEWCRVKDISGAVARDRSQGDRMIGLFCEGHCIKVNGYFFADIAENEELEQAMKSSDMEEEALQAMNARV